MSVRLFDTDNDVVPSAVVVLRLPYGEIDCFALVVAMADHPSRVIDHIPTILRLVVVDMNGMLGASSLCLCR